MVLKKTVLLFYVDNRSEETMGLSKIILLHHMESRKKYDLSRVLFQPGESEQSKMPKYML